MKSLLITLLVISLALLLPAGTMCAETSKIAYEPALLAQAGFVACTPKTATQKTLYEGASSHILLHIDAKGNVFYAFKYDEKGILYLGNEAQYRQYQLLAMRHNLAQKSYRPDNIEPKAAWSWYRAFGPYVFAAAPSSH